jgi:uncharacterized damage-inducible protein DinB
MNVVDLIRYNHVVRELYLEAFSKMPWKEVVKPRGASFDSMRNVFLHLTVVEDRWINYILQGRFNEWVDPDFEDYTDMEMLKAYAQRVKGSTEEYLQKLTPEGHNRKIQVPWGNTPNTKIKVETALTHMVIEDLIHYGELSAMLWQMNVDAPYLGFWRYTYNKQNEQTLTPPKS